MLQPRTVWRLWAKALGQKASDNDSEADKVAIIRTLILTTYLITNAFIVAGVMRHWTNTQTIYIEIHENSNYSEILHSKGWNNLGMDGDTHLTGIYSSATVKNRTGEFE